MILSGQPSDFMQKLSQTAPYKPNNQCCEDILKSLQVKCQTVCEETFNSRKEWKKQNKK